MHSRRCDSTRQLSRVGGGGGGGMHWTLADDDGKTGTKRLCCGWPVCVDPQAEL